MNVGSVDSPSFKISGVFLSLSLFFFCLFTSVIPDISIQVCVVSCDRILTLPVMEGSYDFGCSLHDSISLELIYHTSFFATPKFSVFWSSVSVLCVCFFLLLCDVWLYLGLSDRFGL